MKETLYNWLGLNTWLFHAINNIHNSLLDQFMLLGTSLGEHALFTTYIGMTIITMFISSFVFKDPEIDQQSEMALRVLLAFGVVGLWIDGLAQSWTGIYTVIVVIIAVFVASKTKDRHLSQWLPVIVVFSVAYQLDGYFIGAIKPILDFPRPLLALPPGTVNVVGIPEYHHSLPSGHSSFAMLCVASLWPILSRWGRGMGVFFVLWVGISRVSVGAHFPADVLAGFTSSLLVVISVRYAIRFVIRPREEFLIPAPHALALGNQEVL